MTPGPTQSPSIWWNIGEWRRSLSLRIDAPRADHADRRLAREHRADLHRRGVRAQQPAVRDEQGVLRVARRMVVGEVEQREVVAVVLDLRSLGDAVAEPAEDRDDLVRHPGHRMQRAGERTAAGQRHVDARRPAPGLLGRGRELRLAPLEGDADALLEGVQQLARLRPLLLRHFLEQREERVEEAAVAALDRLPVGERADGGELRGERGLDLRQPLRGGERGPAVVRRHRRLRPCAAWVERLLGQVDQADERLLILGRGELRRGPCGRARSRRASGRR